MDNIINAALLHVYAKNTENNYQKSKKINTNPPLVVCIWSKVRHQPALGWLGVTKVKQQAIEQGGIKSYIWICIQHNAK